VSQTVPAPQATDDEAVLPERVQEALGQLVGTAKEGLLALSVEVGLGVLRELLGEEVDEVVGPKGKWNRDRTGVRYGRENGEVTLGGRRVPVKRPRVRTADGESELPLQSYEHFAGRDPLEGVVLEWMLAGVSTRRYGRAQEPVGEQVESDARSTSKSAASRMFVARTQSELLRLMTRPLSDLRLAVIMLDGIELHGYTASSRWESLPRARSSRWGCGRGRPRTRPWPPRCCRIWSTGASTPSRDCCSSSTDRRR
jgi:putative transposase